MEEDEDVVEAGAEFIGENLQFDLVGDHGDDVLFDHDETLSGEPYDVMVQLQGFGVASGVEFAQSTGAEKLFGQDDGETEDFVQEGGKIGILDLDTLRIFAEIFLIHLRRGHQ